jgi:aminoglycoside phosphotransferase family enzyme
MPRAATAGCGLSIPLQEKVRALRSGAAYDHAVGPIETIETHFAWVFLDAHHAYKLKKPARVGILDQTTLAARERSCAEEVRLNRKLARSVYLGVDTLVRREDGSLHVGGPGQIVDWLVRMRRLPAELMLDRAIELRAVPSARLIAVGELLAQFYAHQHVIEFSPGAYFERIVVRARRDSAELAAPDLMLSSALVDSISRQALAACEHGREDLQGRAYERRIIEGHGDLRPEHVCLSEPPCIIDALEFSLDLRTLDPGEELAFLGIECERLGDAKPGERILESYLKSSQDPISARLMDFYRCRRATVRALVTAWHLRDPQVRDDKPWRARAESYLSQARDYAHRALAR